ncbi:MAG: glycosyltransferase family 2 protein [Actinobacteria bacterium]|nr:glycosyltransferase family 2 protein [Actinomycetota bacterium]
MLVVAIVFWVCAALIVYAQLGYGLLLALLARLWPAAAPPPATAAELPSVSLVVAAYKEEAVIAEKVANVRALDYPADKLELIVACDGSPDATPQRARAAGADVVLELPRGGKIRAQDAGVRAARGEITAFSDANAFWAPDALRELIAPFATDPTVGYVCGNVAFVNADGGTNQEGLYWRYEMWLRALESRLASVTGGNGAIYATRRGAYVEVDPIMGHDLSFPFNMVKRGWKALYASAARASEKMVPSIEGEFARKRRMMSHGWPIVLTGGLLSPKGYGPLYALMIVSHRVLRYAMPFLHLLALLANSLLLTTSPVYVVTMALQCLLVGAAVLARWVPARLLLVARYYVLTQAALAAGLWDWRRHGTEAGWSPPEGTR